MIVKPQFVLCSSMSFKDHHALLYRDHKLGLQCEIYTPIIGGDEYYPRFGKAKKYYYIDGDKRTFRDPKKMLTAYKKQAKGAAHE